MKDKPPLKRKFVPWSDEDTAKARELLARNADPSEFMAALNRSRNAAQLRIRYVDDPTMKEREAARYAERKIRYRMAKEARGISVRASPIKIEIPDAVLQDAWKRINTPRSITASLFGDPAETQSALFKKKTGVPA